MDLRSPSNLNDASPQPPAPHPPGTCLGSDLIITGILGEGGNAVVYAAQHRILGREVAVKMCVGARSGAQQRLIREAKMCASVRDPHIPRIYALEYLDDGTPCVVMEKVEGSLLTRTLARFRMPARVACDIAYELLEALDAVHCAGLVHRDIKPSNLIIDLRPSAKVSLHLLDFGVGKVLRSETLDALDSLELTRQGELLGTPLYMAPEQILSTQVDERADLYATAVLLYEMLTGRTPFQADSIGELFAAVLRDEVTPLCALRPELPRSLELVVQRGMQRDPAQRFESAPAMRVTLLGAMQELAQLDLSDAFEPKPHSPEAVKLDATTIQAPQTPLQREPSALDELAEASLSPDATHQDRPSGERLRVRGEAQQAFGHALPLAKQR